jgi:hypothetical protein
MTATFQPFLRFYFRADAVCGDLVIELFQPF